MNKILLTLGLVAVTFVACKAPTTEEKAKGAAKPAQADNAKLTVTIASNPKFFKFEIVE